MNKLRRFVRKDPLKFLIAFQKKASRVKNWRHCLMSWNVWVWS